MSMKTEIKVITPDEAKRLIASKNPRMVGGKSNVAQWHVEEFARALRSGNFHTTHQGIALDTKGNLIDGFHRLTAIAQTGISAAIQVSYGVEDHIVPLTDRGQRRTNASVMGIDRRVAEIISRLATFACSTGRPDESLLLRFSSVFRDAAEQVIAACPSTRSVFSSAPVKAAAALAFKSGHVYALSRYRSLVLLKPEDDQMIPALIRALTDEYDPNGRLARAWIGFTREKPMEKIIIRDRASVLSEMRAICSSFMS